MSEEVALKGRILSVPGDRCTQGRDSCPALCCCSVRWLVCQTVWEVAWDTTQAWFFLPLEEYAVLPVRKLWHHM